MIAAVVVTHSAPPAMLDACLSALAAGGEVDVIVLIDNGGRAVVPAGLEVPVEHIHTPNEGYGAAANVGFERARQHGCSHVALLNDDVVVRPGWVAPLVAALEPGVGAAQPKVLIAGTSPATINSLGVAVGGDGAGTDIGDGDLDVVSSAVSEISYFTGGAVMFASDFLVATHGFDRRWFLYYEDTDLAARGAELGWRYRLVPAAVVDHARGASTSRDPNRTRYLQERNRLWFAFRHLAPHTVARALWLSVRRLRHSPRRVHARALVAGLAGAPGALWRRRRTGPA